MLSSRGGRGCPVRGARSQSHEGLALLSAACDVRGVMTWETHPVTPDRFEDFADVVNRTRRANHCWCLSHRLRGC